MSKDMTPRIPKSLVWFALCLLVPSTGQVQKYLGDVGVVAYVLVASSTLLISRRYRDGIDSGGSK